MSRIIVNTALDFLRRSSKVTIVEDDNRVLERAETDRDDGLNYSIEALVPELRTVIVLKYFHGYTINEVAEILDISVSTVKNRMHKALNLLRVDIKEG